MEHLSGGDILIRALRDANVKYIWGYPGGAALHIYDAIYRQEDVVHLLVRHEQAAVHAADGFSRTTGEVGTALVTSGPGATNAITGIATAYMDSIPLVVISGQVPSSKIGQDAFQETDMVGVSRPIVKHSFLVTKTEDIAPTIAKAYFIAKSGRPGPVVVDIPKDVTEPNKKVPYQFPKQVKMRSYQPVNRGHQGQIKRAIKTLISSKRPIIYAGGGVIIDNASEHLTQLARRVNAPPEEILRHRLRRDSESGVHVEGLEDLLVRLASCCTPVPGDPIIGFVTRGRGISVHRTDCANALGLSEEQSARLIDVDWDVDGSQSVVNAGVEVVALDRTNLLRDVANALGDHHVNIVSCETLTGDDRVAKMRFEFELKNATQLHTVLHRIKAINSVYDAYRIIPGGTADPNSQ